MSCLTNIFKYCNSCDGVYSSVDVRFTKDCDNSCSFCIEKSGIDGMGKPDVGAISEAIVNSGIKDVLILGGEPFLYPEELYAMISLIRSKVDTIYITTALPRTFITHSEIVNNIIDGVDCLNVSLHAVDSDINNTILNARSKHDRLSVISEYCRKHANKIRVNLNLVKGGIDTKHKLIHSLKQLKLIGVKCVKINELQGAGDLYVSYEDMCGVKLGSPYSTGCYTKISDLFELDIVLKRSCFFVEKTRKASFRDFIKVLCSSFHKCCNKFQVVYENGSVNNKWEKKDVYKNS